MLDFAVNVRAGAPPDWLTERLAARLSDLGRYPSVADELRAVRAVAARHGRDEAEVALLAGGAEGFSLIAGLRPRLAALIAPSFTEPEAALAAVGVPIRHVVLDPPYRLTEVPGDATWSWWGIRPTRRGCCIRATTSSRCGVRAG